MSDDNQSVKAGWSSVQVYTLSAICLLVGITTGYLFRGSTAPKTPTPAAVQAQMPGSEAGGAPQQPTPEDMKRMAEKQVAPMLAALEKNPNDIDNLAKVAHFYYVAGQYEDSAKYYDKLATIKPTVEVLNRLSGAYYKSGSGDKAIEAENRALKIDPKSADALYNLGVLKWQVQGDTKGAVECWETLLKQNPNHPGRAQVEKMIAEVKQHAKIPSGTKTDKPAM